MVSRNTRGIGFQPVLFLLWSVVVLLFSPRRTGWKPIPLFRTGWKPIPRLVLGRAQRQFRLATARRTTATLQGNSLDWL